MKTSTQHHPESELARSLAAEDIRLGDVIAVLDAVYEFPSFLWNGEFSGLAPDEPVRVRLRSRQAGRPLKVRAICLPYVLVETPAGRRRTVDVRQCRLVRLGDAYARKAWKQFAKLAKRKNAGRKGTRR
jgi:hypothetical protein